MCVCVCIIWIGMCVYVWAGCIVCAGVWVCGGVNVGCNIKIPANRSTSRVTKKATNRVFNVIVCVDVFMCVFRTECVGMCMCECLNQNHPPSWLVFELVGEVWVVLSVRFMWLPNGGRIWRMRSSLCDRLDAGSINYLFNWFRSDRAEPCLALCRTEWNCYEHTLT